MKVKKSKIRLVACLAACLVLNGLSVSGAVDNVQAAEGTIMTVSGSEAVTNTNVIYSEDFEAENYTSVSGNELASALGYMPTNLVDTTTDFEVVADGDTGNHVLKFGYHKPSTGEKNPNVKYFFEESVEKAVLKYRFKLADSAGFNGFFFLPRLGSNAILNMNYSKATGTTFREFDSLVSSKVNATSWNDVEVIMDTKTDKYDVYLNNECIVSQAQVGYDKNATEDKWTMNTDSIDLFLVEIFRTSDGACYLDDIEIVEYVACESVAFDNAPAELTVGDSAELSLTYAPTNAYTRDMAFTSSDDEVATVDETGKVTAVGAGTVIITAAPYWEKLDSVTNTPFWGQLELTATTTITVKAAEVQDDGYLYNEDFEDADYLTVTGATLATTLRYTPTNIIDGTTDFEVVADGDTGNHVLKFGYKMPETGAANPSVKFNFKESVQKAVLQYRFKVDDARRDGTFFPPRFGSGNNTQLNYSKINSTQFREEPIITNIITDDWNNVEVILDTVSDKYDIYLNDKCVVSQAGTLGTAQDSIEYFLIEIYRQYTNIVVYLDDITVSEYVEATSVTFSNAPTEMTVGDAHELSLNCTPENAYIRSVEFTSSDESIATVDALGKVTAVAAGTVTITAKPSSGSQDSATATITVKAATVVPVEGIVVDNVENDAVNLPEGGHMILEVSTTPANAAQTEILLSSSDENVVTVDEWGEIVAVGEGTATITLQAADFENVTKSVTVTVNKADPSKTKYIYVSPNGSDTGTGTEADKVSIQGALNLVAANNDNMDGNIEVILDGGYYQQTDTIAFTEEHSGTNNYSVIWRAAEGAQPVIGGGIHIEGSTFAECTEEGLEGIWVVSVDSDVETRQLYVNNVRATRARSEGSLTNPVYDKSYGYICDNTELLTYKDITDLELVWYQNWTNSRCGVAKAEATDDGKVKLTMDQPGWSYVSNKGSATTTSATTEIAWYENALELLDEPGEWYLDEEADKLYYMPRQWEIMANVTVTIPVVEDLVTISGSEDYENMVQNIHFEGITFADTTWMRPSTNVGHCEMQNNHLRENASLSTDRLPDAAITVKRANSIYFTDCTFTRMGITALKMVEGVQNSPVSDSHFYDISGSAITIGEPGVYTASQIDNYYPSDIRKMMKNCDVLNNYIHDVAVEYQSAAAVSVGFAANMDLSYNEIFHIPYSAYHIGYGWDKKFDNVLKNMVISHNFIHDILESKVYDGGAIYALGNTGDGDGSYNVMSNNYIKKQMQGPGVLYPDNGSTYWALTDNVIDLSEVEAWTGGNSNQQVQRWAYVNSPAAHIHCSNIYTTVSAHGGVLGDAAVANDVTYTNIHTCDASNWPAEALTIINASGLQGDDADARRAGRAERIVTNIEGENIVAVGTEIPISTTFTDGKDNEVNGGNITLYYEVDDPSVVEIQGSKLICKSIGRTTVRLYVVSNDILDIIEGEFYVGDELKEVKVEDFEGDLEFVAGITGKQLSLYVVTDMGRILEATSVTYAIGDSTLATVSETGFLKPLKSGETTLTITATAEGKTVTTIYKVTITDAPTYEGLLIHDASELFMAENESYWVKPNSATWEFTADTKIVTKVSGPATYGGQKYEDELLGFRLHITKSGGWPSIVLRAQNTTQEVNASTGYMFCVKGTGLELHRFNNGVRTCIYGDDPSWAPEGGIAGHLITPQPIKHGEEHDIVVGAVDVEAGVRIILMVNGVKVIDYIDTAESAIKDSGYFGIVGRNETFTLTKKVEESIEIIVDNRSEAAGTVVNAPEGGWKEGNNTFTVTSEKASIVLVSYDDGENYMRLTATKTEGDAENCYNFTAENVTEDTQITVAVAGDVNGDGKLNIVDSFRAKAAALGEITPEGIAAFTADVNGDGKYNIIDSFKVKAAVLGNGEISW